ncbi:hypothetical protein IPG36_02380 [bacterium]|nr:MAG: hypothetical protein IPG36_02380 [bacterium]
MEPTTVSAWSYLDELVSSVPGLEEAVVRYQQLRLQQLGREQPGMSYLDWPDSEIAQMTVGEGGLMQTLIDELAGRQFEQPADEVTHLIARMFVNLAKIQAAMRAVTDAEPSIRRLVSDRLFGHVQRLVVRWSIHQCPDPDCLGGCRPPFRDIYN